jgi:hypothetical protein
MTNVTIAADIPGKPRVVFFKVDQDGSVYEYGPVFTNNDFDAVAYCAELAAKIEGGE